MKINYLKEKQKLLFLRGINRTPNPHHVDKMKKSLQILGYCIRPIVVASLFHIRGFGSGLYILDGQHLYEALSALGWDVPYITVEIKDLTHLAQVISKLNSTSKPWGAINYVTMFASIPEKEDYRVLLSKHIQHNLTFSNLVMVYSSGNRGSLMTSLKKGTYEIMHRDLGDEMLLNLEDIFTILPKGNRGAARVFVENYVQYYPGATDYVHEEFKKYIVTHLMEFKSITDGDDSCKDLLDNFK